MRHPTTGRLLALLAGLTPGPGFAHATDQAFVLLLPTQIYIGAGVAAVALTVAALFVLPETWVRGFFRHRPRRQ